MRKRGKKDRREKYRRRGRKGKDGERKVREGGKEIMKNLGLK